jgi:threonine dehydratase
VPSFHPDLVLGVATYALELLAQRAGSRRALCADRAGLGHLRLHPGARPARAEDRDRRRAIDRSAVLCAVVRGRHGGDHREQQYAGRRHGDARPDAEALAIIRKGASRIVQVTDDEIARAIRAYWTDTHNLAEGAGAAALAARCRKRQNSRQAGRPDPERRQYRFRSVPKWIAATMHAPRKAMA